MHYLYRIVNIRTQKLYIGQSKEPNRRWSFHKNQSKKESPSQYIHRAMKKYGIESFIFEVIATCKNSEDADITETILISQYKSRDSSYGYNLRPGGNTRGEWRQSEESKKKMSDNWSRSPESLRKLSESKKGKSISSKGKKKSLAHRKALSEAHKGHRPSQETINKILETKKRKKLEHQL